MYSQFEIVVLFKKAKVGYEKVNFLQNFTFNFGYFQQPLAKQKFKQPAVGLKNSHLAIKKSHIWSPCRSNSAIRFAPKNSLALFIFASSLQCTVRVFLLSIEFLRVTEALEPSRKNLRVTEQLSKIFKRSLENFQEALENFRFQHRRTASVCITPLSRYRSLLLKGYAKQPTR